MLFLFISPERDGRLVDIRIDAPDLHAAFRVFATKHWDVYRSDFGIWHRGALVGRVFTGLTRDTGEYGPFYTPIDQFPVSSRGVVNPSEN